MFCLRNSAKINIFRSQKEILETDLITTYVFLTYVTIKYISFPIKKTLIFFKSFQETQLLVMTCKKRKTNEKQLCKKDLFL